MNKTLFDHYRLGVQNLTAAVEYTHPRIHDVLILYHRLIENIDNTFIYGENPLLKRDRLQILGQCETLCLELTQKPFQTFCELPETLPLQSNVPLPLVQITPTASEQRDRFDAYLSEMKSLLLKEGLLFSEETASLRQTARQHTLNALKNLNSKLKRELVEFLYGTELIFTSATIISLAEASLVRAYLEGIHLAWGNLKASQLQESNLAWGNLAWADLTASNLTGANLFCAHLEKAHLNGANLQRANLLWTALEGAEYDQATRWPAGFDPIAAGAIKGL